MRSKKQYIILALFAISVFLNLVAYRLYRIYSRTITMLRLDPFELHKYPLVDTHLVDAKLIDSEKVRVVFFGDSRAYAWPQLGGLISFEFINRGISAQTSAQVAGRFARHVLSLQPDVIVLQVGINDLKSISVFPANKSVIIAECKKNIANIVSKALQHNMIVILTTILPYDKHIPFYYQNDWSYVTMDLLIDVNQFLTSLADDKVFILDTAEIVADEDGYLREEYRKDFLHLNQAGYNALNAHMLGMFQELSLTVHKLKL